MSTFKVSLSVSLFTALALTGCNVSDVDPMYSAMGGQANALSTQSSAEEGSSPYSRPPVFAGYNPLPTNANSPAPTTGSPTSSPTNNPTPVVTGNPTTAPTGNPTTVPNPTSNPTTNPTPVATNTPTSNPTASPTPENRTVIELLTPTIINNAANQFLKFRVSYIGPNGNPVAFPFDDLLFDIASINATGARSLGYSISVSNQVEYAGYLDPVWGEDLFGNAGSNYYHYATDQRLDIQAGVTWFVFTVNLSNMVNHPYGSRAPYPRNETIPVYVRFGHDSLAAEVNVNFVNQ